MSLINVNRGPIIKRLPTRRDSRYEIVTYGQDNLYPQMAEQIMIRSWTAQRGADVFGNFTNGEGFEDESLDDLIVNRRGESATEVMFQAVKSSYRIYKGVCLHVQYNGAFEISEITSIPFRNARMKFPNEFGMVDKILLSNNWERDTGKSISIDPVEYDVFNPDPAVIRTQWERDGFQNYKGQILYHTPEKWVYPLTIFDPVLDQAQTQADIGIFNLSSIQNGFYASKIMKYPGEFNNDDEKQEFLNQLRGFKGPIGGNSLLVLEAAKLAGADGQLPTLLEDLTIPSMDRLFELTEKNVKMAIQENFGFPREVMAISPESGMFNQENMRDAYIYSNTITKNDRKAISRLFEKVLSLFKEQVTDNYDIKPEQYMENEAIDNAFEQE